MGPGPYVTVSYAQSIDGRIATKTGDSQYISGKRTLRLAHKLRKINDAILVGIETVLTDDPLLTCRVGGREKKKRNPVRVILDSNLRIPLGSRIVETAAAVPTIVFTCEHISEKKRTALQTHGIQIETGAWNAQSERIDLARCLRRLDELQIKTLFVEGGGRVITAFVKENLVDKMIVITAPFLLGAGIPSIGDLEITVLGEAIRPYKTRFRRYGHDSAWELYFGGGNVRGRDGRANGS
jgi:riboflavin-specific deaminase-like protein